MEGCCRCNNIQKLKGLKSVLSRNKMILNLKVDNIIEFDVRMLLVIDNVDQNIFQVIDVQVTSNRQQLSGSSLKDVNNSRTSPFLIE